MLGARDIVPHFEVASIDGTVARYAALWQRKNLVLLALPAENAADFSGYVNQLGSLARELDELHTELVITRTTVPGVDAPGVLVADKWGEIHVAASAASPGELPEPADLVEWARYLERQCPECEGEAR